MAKQKREQELEQGRQEQLREETQEQPGPEQVGAEQQEEESSEKMTKWRAVHLAIAEIDGSTTYGDIIDRAEELLKAAGEEADRDRLWNEVEKAMTHLQALGLVDCEWEVHVILNVPKLGLPSKNGK
jgi:hypothetical protein